MAAANQERLDDAARFYDEALRIRLRVLGPDHADTLSTRNNLAALYYQQSDFERAAPMFREGMEQRRRQFGDDHPAVATSRNNLGAVLLTLGDLAGAEAEYREALRIRLSAYGEGHSSVAVTRYHLGRVLRDQGEEREAEALMRRALATLPARDSNRPGCKVDMGEMLLGQGRLPEAGSLLDEAVRESAEIEGPDHWRTAAARSARGAWHLASGDRAAAERDLAAAWSVLRSRPESDHRRRLTERRLEELAGAAGRAGPVGS
jgi:tetratricopeptide (TPR) repeat protein